MADTVRQDFVAAAVTCLAGGITADKREEEEEEEDEDEGDSEEGNGDDWQ